MSKPKVALTRTSPETVLDDMARLFRLADGERALDRDRPTVLRDQLSWDRLFPGANTTPWQLEGAIRALRRAGFEDLTAVECEGLDTSARRADRANKLDVVLRKYGVPVRWNFNPREMEWVPYEPRAEMLVLDRLFRRLYRDGIRVPAFFFGRNVVHLPTLKTHIFATLAGAMENAFAGLLDERRRWAHPWIHEALVDLLAIEREIHAGQFAFMDGTTCGNGPGPRTMFPAVKNLVIGGADPVAVDAVAAHIMGFDPLKVRYLRLAHERGLGVARLDEIDLAGMDPAEARALNFGFTVGDSLTSRASEALWHGPLGRPGRLLLRTPLVHALVAGSLVYDDLLWYQFEGRRRVRDWLDHTEWGALFRRY